MPCNKCQLRPGYHSFEFIGFHNNTNLFYSSPAKGEDYNEGEERLKNIKIHIDEQTTGKPWTLIVDCNNMTTKHYTDVSFNINLLKYIIGNNDLISIWIIQPNVWIKGIITLFQKTTKSLFIKKIHYFNEPGIALYNKFKEYKLDNSAIEKILHRIQKIS
jgi:hypothetical protein